MQYLRRLSILSFSTLLILGAIHYGPDIVTLVITPLPQNLQSCIKDKISTEVNAQAICTGTTDNTFSVWTQGGKLQDTNIFYTETTPSTTLSALTENIANAGIRINTSYTVGAYTPGVFWTTSNNNPTKPKAGIFLQEDGSGTDMILATSNVFGTGITNTGLTINEGGNAVLGGITGIGDSRLAVLSTNGDNDAQITVRKPSQTALSFLSWDGVAHISAGTYYNNGVWTHANAGGNINSQILRLVPGTGVDWLTSSNSSGTFTTQKVLWNTAGAWVSQINSGGATFTGDTTGFGNSVFDGRVWSGNADMYVSPPNGGTVIINTAFRGAGGAIGGVANLQVSGAVTSSGRLNAGENIQILNTGNGLTSTHNNSARIAVNNGSGHGAWTIAGHRTGSVWYGLNFETFGGNTMLMTGSTGQAFGQQQTGMFNQSQSQWLWYFAHRDLYAERLVDVSGSGFSVDPAGTSVLNQLRTGGYTSGSANSNSFNLEVGGIPTAGANPASTNGQAIIYFHHHGLIAHQLRYSASTLYLERAGNGYGTSANPNLWVGGAVNSNLGSDGRYKKNIKPIENALDTLSKFNSITYQWTDPKEMGIDEEPGKSHMGFIAQEVQKIFPDWIYVNEEGKYFIKDNADTKLGFQALVVQALKEITKKLTLFEENQQKHDEIIQKQQELIETQKQTILQLEKRVEKLEYK